jgi:hypothetical protein
VTQLSPATVRKRHGQHYTPSELANFLARRVVAALPEKDHFAILDPACGDGELLLAALSALAEIHPAAEVRVVGFDIDKEAIELAADRLASAGVDAELIATDFLPAAASYTHEFDAIISNPPYVRVQNLGADAAKLLSEKYGLAGRIDLTHPFVAAAPELLMDEGVFGLLCSNRFLTTKAGANVRGIFGTKLAPIEVYDLGDTKLFEAAVLPAIVISTKGPFTGPATYASVYEVSEVATDEDLFSALVGGLDTVVSRAGKSYAVTSGLLHREVSPELPWRIHGTDESKWFNDLAERTWKTFGDVAKIRVGIKTTADSVFLRDDWDSLPAAHVPEQQILLPLTTHRNAAAWRLPNAGGLRVLYPYDLRSERRMPLNLDEYPRAAAYLASHRPRLEGREYVVNAGRNWWEIWVPQKPSWWKQPKIVFPDISEEPKFALDDSGAVVNGDCYWISLLEIGDDRIAMLMLAIANSELAVRFYDHACGNKLYSGKRRWISQYVSRFPLPDPSTEEADAVINYADRAISRGLNDEEKETLDALVYAAFAASSPKDTLF